MIDKNCELEAEVIVLGMFRGKLCVWEVCLGAPSQGEWLIPEEAKTRIIKMCNECQCGNLTRITALSVISSLAVL